MENDEILEQETNLEQQQEQQQQQQEQEFKWDAELFKQLVQTPEGKKEIQRAMDKNFSKGLETWKKNNLDALVQEKYNELHPTDLKEQEILKLKKELAQKEIQDSTIKLLEQAEIPVSFSVYFKSDNLETTQEAIKTFVEHFNQAVNKEVKKRLPNTTPKGYPQQYNWITKEQLLAMNYNDRTKFFIENPEEYNRIMNG